MESSKYIFLLGGHDLEMLEIKRILTKNKATVIDRNLKWDNANWEIFQDLFNQQQYAEKTFVGVELAKQDFQPKNSINIDHHNDMEEKSSSLEQILQLINLQEPLSRHQKLIVANDIGYIPELRAMGATKDEIIEIRNADRKAQGVTSEDEKLAQKAIENHKKVHGTLTVVYSETNRFSAIADRLYDKVDQLLIHTKDELTFYGSERGYIEGLYSKDMFGKSVYKGGGINGYLGLAKGKWTEDEILKEVSRIILCLTKKIHSHHIFLFPFKWGAVEGKSGLKSLQQFKESLQNCDHGDWKNSQYKWVSTAEQKKGYPNYRSGLDNYNEANYFYPHVREMLYELPKEQAVSSIPFMHHFEFELKKCEPWFNILLKESDDPDAHQQLNPKSTYRLKIDSIILNVYRTKTAVLSFHLKNYDHPDQEDILKINKYGRRLSVPFFDLNPDSIYTTDPDQSDLTSRHDILSGTKLYEIPNAIWIGTTDLEKNSLSEKLPFYEDFSRYRAAENYKNGPFILPAFIADLFSCKNAKKSVPQQIEPLLDDRMHLISWYGNTALIDNMKELTTQNTYAFEQSDWWYKYVYADTTVMQTDRFKRKEVLRNQTCSRFVEWGTLYGISRYSFVMLTGHFSGLMKGRVTYLVRHLQSMYYKMVELCLLQRATIVYFSEEVANLSRQVSDLEKNENQQKVNQIVNDIQTLYRDYLLFINRIYFREVTPQEQGIELYNLLQQTMGLPDEVKNLDDEIQELNTYVQSVNEKRKAEAQDKLARKGHNLTAWGAIFLVPTFIAGFIGMNTMPESWMKYSESQLPLWISASVVTLSIIVTAIIVFRKKSKKN
ncbi:MAG: hypothetical protein MI810_16755 [Flavobacteriales bacterium]|nr:hypothetical protein [Flavobacteriales bacterium]